jgi:hypothetical protein
MDDELSDTTISGRRVEISDADPPATQDSGAATSPMGAPPPPPPPPPPPVAGPRAGAPPQPTVAQAPVSAAGQPAAGAGEWTEVTRLMCASAYLDGTFAQDVVDEVLHEHHRAVHIPPGIDIATVAKHCLAACRQKVVRDVLLTADLLLALVLAVVGESALWLVVGFVLAWAIVLWDVWSATYQVVVKRLNPLVFGSHAAPEPADPRLARRIAELSAEQNGNLTVYSGFLPFSGAGLRAGGWSFVVDLRKGKEALGQRVDPVAPTVIELYSGVRRTLATLGMANVQVKDRLFVSGSDIREDRTLLPDPLRRPLSRVDPSLMGHYVTSPTHRIRHYQCTEIVDWRGELVVSLFLRFAVHSGRMFCELSKFVLVPLKEEFHRLDHLGSALRPGDVMSMVSRSLFITPGLSLRAPKVVLRPFKHSRELADSTKRVEDDPFFDYGAPVTVLDRARSNGYRRYFQMLDKEMYVKVLERTVLDTIVEILDEHGVDTAELTESRSTIINNGIMMPQGTMQAESVAVGTGASILNRVRSAATSAPKD